MHSSLLHTPGADWAPMKQPPKADLMKPSAKNLLVALGFAAAGMAIAAAGIYVGDTDDAPGAAVLSILLMIGAVAVAVKFARRK